MRRRRWWLLGVTMLAAVVAGGFGARRLWRPPETVLPAFVEPGAGPRAVASDGLGFKVGRTTLAEARDALAARGLECPDTSMRALMRGLRAAKKRELEAKRARGEPTDAVSGASAVNRPSPKERNPQVRLSCEPVDSARLRDRARLDVRGRWLFVFDSPEHPLRHVSFERTHADKARAEADVVESVAALTVAFGSPTRRPAREDLAWLAPVAYEWQFADLHVRVFALAYGEGRIHVSETVEVPWPVRADAPALSTPMARR